MPASELSRDIQRRTQGSLQKLPCLRTGPTAQLGETTQEFCTAQLMGAITLQPKLSAELLHLLKQKDVQECEQTFPWT